MASWAATKKGGRQACRCRCADKGMFDDNSPIGTEDLGTLTGGKIKDEVGKALDFTSKGVCAPEGLCLGEVSEVLHKSVF